MTRSSACAAGRLPQTLPSTLVRNKTPYFVLRLQIQHLVHGSAALQMVLSCWIVLALATVRGQTIPNVDDVTIPNVDDVTLPPVPDVTLPPVPNVGDLTLPPVPSYDLPDIPIWAPDEPTLPPAIGRVEDVAQIPPGFPGSTQTTPAPTPSNAVAPGTTHWGYGNGWCYSNLDSYVGYTSTGTECWTMCESYYGTDLVAIDWTGSCYCQNDCQCMYGSGYYVVTRDSISALPQSCSISWYGTDDTASTPMDDGPTYVSSQDDDWNSWGDDWLDTLWGTSGAVANGCDGTCAGEDLYNGHCGAFWTEVENKWKDWAVLGMEWDGCQRDTCCASSSSACCELNVGLVAGLACGGLVFILCCVTLCCFTCTGCPVYKARHKKTRSGIQKGEAPLAQIALGGMEAEQIQETTYTSEKV